MKEGRLGTVKPAFVRNRSENQYSAWADGETPLANKNGVGEFRGGKTTR